MKIMMAVCNGLLILVLTIITACMAQTRPNIVIIMADDMGWGDVGANWPQTVDTPVIDQLAQDGLRLTDFHSGASVCTPSRAALLTGRLGLRTGVIKNFGDNALGGIPTNETTIAEILMAAGYRTAMLGKWHLGTQPGHHPLDKGFESYLGVPYSVDMGCADPPGANLPACPACPEDNSVYQFAPAPETCTMDTAIPLYKNKTIAHQPVKLANLSTMYADFAKNFIQNVSSTAPYFLYAALSHMHVPLAHAQEYDNATGRGDYADTLREMDALVGSILSAVRETNNNTFIWFTSDNGPWEMKCQLAGSVGPFIGMWQASPEGGGGGSGAKTTVWEAGHRVPSILYWPNHIEAGRISSALTSALDILPTLTALGKGKLSNDRQYDGKDMTSIITGTSESIRQVLFHPNSGVGEDGVIGALRVENYKVVYYSGGAPDCSGEAGPVQNHTDTPLVFKLNMDLSEGSPLDRNSSTAAPKLHLIQLHRPSAWSNQYFKTSLRCNTNCCSNSGKCLICCFFLLIWMNIMDFNIDINTWIQ